VSSARQASYEGARALDTALALFQERAVLIALEAARAAAAGNDASALTVAIAALETSEPGKQGKLAATIAELKLQLATLQSGKSTGAALPDLVGFDKLADLDAFPERSGGWGVSGGWAVNNGDATLQRSDCGNARTATVAFRFAQAVGGVHIDFRGCRLMLDLGRQSWRLDSKGDRRADTALPLVANTRYTVHMAWDEAAGVMAVGINQAEPVKIRPGALSAGFRIGLDAGAGIEIDQVELRRLGAPAAVADEATMQKQREVLKQVLGFEHFGGAYKDPASEAIVLPGAGNQRAGIGAPLRSDVIGMRFAIDGRGPIEQPGMLMLSLGIADGVRPTGKFLEFKLPPAGAAPMQVEVRWTATKYTVSLRQPGMADHFIENDRAADAQHLIIAATGPGRILTTPDPIRP
jgi:hypothetical protein